MRQSSWPALRCGCVVGRREDFIVTKARRETCTAMHYPFARETATTDNNRSTNSLTETQCPTQPLTQTWDRPCRLASTLAHHAPPLVLKRCTIASISAARTPKQNTSPPSSTAPRFAVRARIFCCGCRHRMMKHVAPAPPSVVPAKSRAASSTIRR